MQSRLDVREFIVLFALLMSLNALTIDAMLPALPAIAEDLNVSDSKHTQLVISMFILGSVFGELIFGPISDAFGRKKSVIFGIAVYATGTLIAIFSSSLFMLLAGRMIQGVGISGSRIGARALIRDLFVGEQMARIMSFIFTIFIIIPMIAPLMGQQVTEYFGWRAIFIAFLIHATIAVGWFLIRQEETLTPERRIPLSFSNIWRSANLIVRHVKVMSYTLVSGFVLGGMIVYLSTSQAMFEDFYQKGEQFPLLFAFLAIGIGMAAIINGKIVVRVGMHRVCKWALLGITLCSSFLLLYGRLYDGIPPFYGLMALMFCILFFVGFMFGNINAMCMQWLGGIAGIGSSVVGSLSSLTGVTLSVIAGRFYAGDIFALAGTFLFVGIVSLALLSVAKRAEAISL